MILQFVVDCSLDSRTFALVKNALLRLNNLAIISSDSFWDDTSGHSINVFFPLWDDKENQYKLEPVFPSASPIKNPSAPCAASSASQANMQAETNLRAFHHALSSMSLPLPCVLQGRHAESRLPSALLHNHSQAAQAGQRLPGGEPAGHNAASGANSLLHPQAHQLRHPQPVKRTESCLVQLLRPTGDPSSHGKCRKIVFICSSEECPQVDDALGDAITEAADNNTFLEFLLVDPPPRSSVTTPSFLQRITTGAAISAAGAARSGANASADLPSTGACDGRRDAAGTVQALRSTVEYYENCSVRSFEADHSMMDAETKRWLHHLASAFPPSGLELTLHFNPSQRRSFHPPASHDAVNSHHPTTSLPGPQSLPAVASASGALGGAFSSRRSANTAPPSHSATGLSLGLTIACVASPAVLQLRDTLWPCQTCSCHGAVLPSSLVPPLASLPSPRCPVTGQRLDRADVNSNAVLLGRQHGLLFGTPYVVVASQIATPTERTDGDDFDDEAVERNLAMFAALCSNLRASGAALLCSSMLDISTRCSVSFPCYYLLLPSATCSLLLKRLAAAEEVLPLPLPHPVNSAVRGHTASNTGGVGDSDADEQACGERERQAACDVRTALQLIPSHPPTPLNPLALERGCHQRLHTLLRESLQFQPATSGTRSGPNLHSLPRKARATHSNPHLSDTPEPFTAGQQAPSWQQVRIGSTRPIIPTPSPLPNERQPAATFLPSCPPSMASVCTALPKAPSPSEGKAEPEDGELEWWKRRGTTNGAHTVRSSVGANHCVAAGAGGHAGAVGGDAAGFPSGLVVGSGRRFSVTMVSHPHMSGALQRGVAAAVAAGASGGGKGGVLAIPGSESVEGWREEEEDLTADAAADMDVDREESEEGSEGGGRRLPTLLLRRQTEGQLQLQPLVPQSKAKVGPRRVLTRQAQPGMQAGQQKAGEQKRVVNAGGGASSSVKGGGQGTRSKVSAWRSPPAHSLAPNTLVVERPTRVGRTEMTSKGVAGAGVGEGGGGTAAAAATPVGGGARIAGSRRRGGGDREGGVAPLEGSTGRSTGGCEGRDLQAGSPVTSTRVCRNSTEAGVTEVRGVTMLDSDDEDETGSHRKVGSQRAGGGSSGKEGGLGAGAAGQGGAAGTRKESGNSRKAGGRVTEDEGRGEVTLESDSSGGEAACVAGEEGASVHTQLQGWEGVASGTPVRRRSSSGSVEIACGGGKGDGGGGASRGHASVENSKPVEGTCRDGTEQLPASFVEVAASDGENGGEADTQATAVGGSGGDKDYCGLGGEDEGGDASTEEAGQQEGELVIAEKLVVETSSDTAVATCDRSEDRGDDGSGGRKVVGARRVTVADGGQEQQQSTGQGRGLSQRIARFRRIRNGRVSES